MKNFAYLLGFMIFMLFSCNTVVNTTNNVEIEGLISNNNFTFMAQRVNITNPDVNNILNSMPNSASSRIQNLDYGYSIIIKDNVLDVNLPYFGRLFNPSFDTSKNGIKFTSKNFSINKSQTKKGNQIIEVHPNDSNNVRTIYLEVYKSGKAYVSIDASDRQPISYDGYLTKNEETKK